MKKVNSYAWPMIYNFGWTFKNRYFAEDWSPRILFITLSSWENICPNINLLKFAFSLTWPCFIPQLHDSKRIHSKLVFIFSREPRLYKRLGPSVGPSVGPSDSPSVRWSVGPLVRNALSRRAETSRRRTNFVNSNLFLSRLLLGQHPLRIDFHLNGRNGSRDTETRK